MAARRLQKSSSQESRLSMGGLRREAILYSKHLLLRAVTSVATKQTSFLAS